MLVEGRLISQALRGGGFAGRGGLALDLRGLGGLRVPFALCRPLGAIRAEAEEQDQEGDGDPAAGGEHRGDAAGEREGGDQRTSPLAWAVRVIRSASPFTPPFTLRVTASTLSFWAGLTHPARMKNSAAALADFKGSVRSSSGE